MGREGYLGCVQELGGVFVFDDTDEHTVGYAGDEVADVVRAEKRRHGAAEGFCSCFVGGVAGLGAGEGVGAGLVTSGGAAGDCGWGFGRWGRHRLRDWV